MENKQNGYESNALAVIHTDAGVREDSSSGGVFSALAAYILRLGGVVFGAAFDAAWMPQHIAVRDAAGCAALRGAKYVQSALGDSYAEVKAALESGRTVLFTGTPCQVNGLAGYLKRPYAQLYTADLICHGSPQRKAWAGYLAQREAAAGARCTGVTFRDKADGWAEYSIKMTFENGAVYRKKAAQDPYMRLFLGDYILSDACYTCANKGDNRAADLTLGDCWGVSQFAPALHDNRGTSLVLVRSAKGEKLLRNAAGVLRAVPVDAARAAAANPSLHRAADMPADRTLFLAELARLPFDTLADKYTKKQTGGWMRKIAARLKRKPER